MNWYWFKYKCVFLDLSINYRPTYLAVSVCDFEVEVKKPYSQNSVLHKFHKPVLDLILVPQHTRQRKRKTNQNKTKQNKTTDTQHRKNTSTTFIYIYIRNIARDPRIPLQKTKQKETKKGSAGTIMPIIFVQTLLVILLFQINYQQYLFSVLTPSPSLCSSASCSSCLSSTAPPPNRPVKNLKNRQPASTLDNGSQS